MRPVGPPCSVSTIQHCTKQQKGQTALWELRALRAQAQYFVSSADEGTTRPTSNDAHNVVQLLHHSSGVLAKHMVWSHVSAKEIQPRRNARDCKIGKEHLVPNLSSPSRITAIDQASTR